MSNSIPKADRNRTGIDSLIRNITLRATINTQVQPLATVSAKSNRAMAGIMWRAACLQGRGVVQTGLFLDTARCHLRHTCGLGRRRKQRCRLAVQAKRGLSELLSVQTVRECAGSAKASAVCATTQFTVCWCLLFACMTALSVTNKCACSAGSGLGFFSSVKCMLFAEDRSQCLAHNSLCLCSSAQFLAA